MPKILKRLEKRNESRVKMLHFELHATVQNCYSQHTVGLRGVQLCGDRVKLIKWCDFAAKNKMANPEIAVPGTPDYRRGERPLVA